MIGHIVPKRVYWSVYAALIVLLVLTVYAATVHLGRSVNITIALTIAVIKMTLVALYFMHVRYSSKLVWVFAGAGVLWFVILVGLTLSDYVSRGWIPVFGR